MHSSALKSAVFAPEIFLFMHKTSENYKPRLCKVQSGLLNFCSARKRVKCSVQLFRRHAKPNWFRVFEWAFYEWYQVHWLWSGSAYWLGAGCLFCPTGSIFGSFVCRICLPGRRRYRQNFLQIFCLNGYASVCFRRLLAAELRVGFPYDSEPHRP